MRKVKSLAGGPTISKKTVFVIVSVTMVAPMRETFLRRPVSCQRLRLPADEVLDRIYAYAQQTRGLTVPLSHNWLCARLPEDLHRPD